MKIAYLAEWDFSQPSGVSKKIQSQMQAWNRGGADVRLHVISANTRGQFANFARAKFYTANVPILTGAAKTYLNKILCAREVFQDLNDWQPDLIYYRLGIWYPGLSKILKLAKSVIELNSLELNELEGANPVKRRLYPWGRQQILSQAVGYVCVSDEIARDLEASNRPVLVCANGYDFRSVPKINREIVSDRPQGLFVSSDNQFWQGVDLILKLAQELPEIDFHLVGISPHPASSNVFFHGPLFGEGLAKLTRRMDFGVGTLALHRKRMEEASPLKSREYGAWGLPFIYAYKDTDLPEFIDFALKLPNSENGVLQGAARIRDFAHRWKGQEHDPQRFYAYFDMDEKEKRRLNFLASL